MNRLSFLLLVFGFATSLFAQESPTPIDGESQPIRPIPAPKKGDRVPPACPCRPLTSDSCICPIYPVWWDGDTTYLYYSEICDASPGCPVVDVGYRVGGPIDWPLECGGTNSNCGQCDFSGDSKKGGAPPAFDGLVSAFPSKTPARAMLPAKAQHNDPTQWAYPQRGIKQATEFFVRFKTDDYGVVYAKVFVASMKTNDANAPRNVAVRPLLIGYEVKNDSDLPLDELIAEPRVTASDAVFTPYSQYPGQKKSNFVQRVSIDGKLHFLVLLAHRDLKPLNTKAEDDAK